jgi:hypothetical protein
MRLTLPFSFVVTTDSEDFWEASFFPAVATAAKPMAAVATRRRPMVVVVFLSFMSGFLSGWV